MRKWISKQTQRLFSERLDQWRGVRGFALRSARLAVLTAREFRADFCVERGMSLAFATLMSLFPLTVLFITVAGSLGSGEVEGGAESQPNAVIQFVEEKVFYALAPEFKEPLKKWFDETESFDTWPTGIINLVAVVVLFLSALGVLLTAERVFNRIWKTPGRRTYLQKVMAFWVILTTSPFMIIASVAVGEMVSDSGALGDLANRDGFIGLLYSLMLPISIGFFGFTLLFLFMPSARVRITSAASGALFAAIMWELSKRGFRFYIEWAGKETNFYSHVFAVPLFLLWLYLTWLIALAGGELSYVHQHFRVLSRTTRQARERRHSLAFFGIFILAKVATAFRRKEPAQTLTRISAELDCDEQGISQEVAAWLLERRIVAEDAHRPGVLVLAADPRDIRIREVVEGLRSLEFPGEPVASGAVDSELERVEALFGASFDSGWAHSNELTLDEFIPVAEDGAAASG